MTMWYLIRSLGFVSLIALTASTVLGALATSGDRRIASIDARVFRQILHRSLGVLGLVVLVGHIALAVVDSYVPLGVAGALVPFASGYRPLPIALGVLGVYALIVTAVSGAVRRQVSASPGAIRFWRGVHVAAYGGWVLSMAHGIFSGTDTRVWWAIATYVGCGLAVGAAVVVRLCVPARRTRDVSGHLRLTGALR
ncbi:ferric reductase [Nocardioides sp.]|uniref:ferric reductase n=1 Tax=Nocardioides sp. TaxID=35761 RepID=UPI0026308D46|nr:ferric reductase [Nocardioides sp.]